MPEQAPRPERWTYHSCGSDLDDYIVLDREGNTICEQLSRGHARLIVKAHETRAKMEALGAALSTIVVVASGEVFETDTDKGRLDWILDRARAAIARAKEK